MLGTYIPRLFWALLLLWVMAGILVLIRTKTKSYPFDRYLSIFLAISFGVAAFLSVLKQQVVINNDNKSCQFLATILEYPAEKPNSVFCRIKIEYSDSVCFNGQVILAYFEKNEKADSLQPGSQVLVKSQISPIKNSDEPYAFDYQKFMANRNIYYTSFIPSKNYFQLENRDQVSILVKAEKFRSSLITLLKKYVQNDEQQQVISALTLGYRKELSPETRSYFTSTGAMHVLAVSGLHVGMIYLFLSNILAFLKRYRSGRLLYLFIIAGLLWSYALLTGFSPSVQRATVMFCFILIGSSLQRPASIYNSIAASAFLLLLFNPKLIFEVGFQLSYAAVISIVFFYPRLEKLLSPKTKLIQKMWQLFCVSLAAQAGTFALSIYYFHQFPVYFWLSNFIVIPAAYLILGFTFLFFLCSPIHWLAVLISKLLSAVTWTTIFALQKIDSLPYSLIENMSITMPQLFFLMAVNISLLFFIKQKIKIFFFLTISFILLFLITGLVEKTHHFNQKKMIVYDGGKKIHLINGRKNYLVYKDSEIGSNQTGSNIIRELQLEPATYVCLDSCNSFYSTDLMLQNRIIQFLDQTVQLEDNEDR